MIDIDPLVLDVKSPAEIISEVKLILSSLGRVSLQKISMYTSFIYSVTVNPAASEEEKAVATTLFKELKEKTDKALTDSFVEQCTSIIEYEQANLDAVLMVDIRGKLNKEDFEEIDEKPFARGGFGAVFAGMCKAVPVAIKRVDVDNPDLDVEEETKCLKTEAMIMARMRHPNCCEYMGYLEEPFSLVSRRYPCTLEDLIFDGNLSMVDRFRIAYQVTSGLYYMHSLKLLHRDLKPDNVFIDEDTNARLADFGFTEYVAGRRMKDGQTTLGTEMYMAPELLENREFDEKCEVYSLGLTIFALFSKKHPFGRVKTGKVADAQKKIRYLPFDESDYSTHLYDGKPLKELYDLLSRCFAYDAENRPELCDVLTNLVDIGIRSVIRRSSTAEEYWKQLCHGTFRSRLQVFELAKTINPEDPKSVITLLSRACPSSWNLLEITQFWDICCWFPRFFSEGYNDMKTIVDSLWYAQDENEVLRRFSLKGMKDAKAFLIRPSVERSFTEPFIVCTVDMNKRKDFKVIRVKDKETGEVHLTCSILPSATFLTLPKVAVAVCRQLGYRIAMK